MVDKRFQNPTVAVCIPTYNQSDYLASTVESVINQTIAPTEIWISDDCSTDDTQSVCKKLTSEYPFIKYVRQKHNLGMSGNPRWIVRQPKTDYIAKLDSDDQYCSNYLEELVCLLSKYEKAGYVHAATQYIDKDNNDLFVSSLARNNEFVHPSRAFQESFNGFKVTANILLYRRTALESVDYFKEDLQFCDDWDIGVRLAAAGWGNAYTNKVLSRYRVWDDNKNTRARRHISQVECSTRVFNESIYPNLSKFNIDKKSVDRYRNKLAFRHALKSDQHYDNVEKQHLQNAIRKLATNKATYIYGRVANLIGADYLMEKKHNLKRLVKNFFFNNK